MKKLISALCTISILLSTAFSSFAAVKITNVFVDGDGSYWYFGSFDPETDTDVGLEVNGKEYNLNNKEKMDIRHRFHHMWDGVRGTGYFGIGLKDKKNILKGEKAEVKPYAITNGEKIYGESVYFGGSVATPAGSTVISSITVGGEAIPGVDSGKTDYYYGLLKLPSDVSELPSVVSASSGNVSYETSREAGGFVTVITVVSESTYEYRVHFREIKEATVSSNDIFSVLQGGFLRSESDEWAFVKKNEFGYLGYDVSGLGGEIIPLEATLAASYAVNLPATFTVGSSFYRDRANINIWSDTESRTIDHSQFVQVGQATVSEKGITNITLDAKSIRVINGKILLCHKRDGDLTSYVYPSELTIKYIDKNPQAFDATLKSIRVDGVELSDFTPEKKIYNVEISDWSNIPVITAEANVPGAKVVISDGEITVTSENGKITNTYKVNIGTRKTETVSYSKMFGLVKSNGFMRQDYENMALCKSTEMAYACFKTEADTDAIASINVTSKYWINPNTTVDIYGSDFTSFAEVSALANSERTVDFVSPEVLASVTFETEKQEVTANIPADKIKFAEDGSFIIRFGKSSGDSGTYILEPSVTITYLDTNPSASDATLKAVKLNGEELAGFDSEASEIIVEVSDLGNLPVITAEATNSKATVSITDNIITVTSENGKVTKTYTVIFGIKKTATYNVVDGKIFTVLNTWVRNDGVNYGAINAGTELPYAVFDVSDMGESAKILSAELTASFSGKGVGGYIAGNGSFLSVDDAKEKISSGNPDIKNGVTPVTGVYNYETELAKITQPVDVSKLKVTDGKISFVFAPEGTQSAKVYLWAPTLEITYLDTNPGSSDATLKSVKLNGEELAGFDSEASEIIVEVSDLGNLPVITAEATNSKATVSITDNIITVTSENGKETKTYTVIFGVKKTATYNVVDGKVFTVLNTWVRNDGVNYGAINAGTELPYAVFDVSDMSEGSRILSAELTASFSGSGVGGYIAGNGSFLSVDDAKEKISSGNPDIKNGVTPVTGVFNYETELAKITQSVDVSKLKVTDGKISFVFAPEGTQSAKVYLWAPTLEITYFDTDAGADNAKLKAIYINGKAIEGFSPDVYEYYISAEENGAVITAEAEKSDASVIVDGNVITVTSANGEVTATYKVYFEELETGYIMSVEENPMFYLSAANGSLGAKGTTASFRSNVYGYAQLSTSLLPENAEIKTAKLYAKYTSNGEAFQVGGSAYSTYEEISALEASQRLDDAADFRLAGAGSFSTDGEIVAVDLDVSKLNIKNGNLLLVFRKEASTKASSVSEAYIEVQYSVNK